METRLKCPRNSYHTTLAWLKTIIWKSCFQNTKHKTNDMCHTQLVMVFVWIITFWHPLHQTSVAQWCLSVHLKRNTFKVTGLVFILIHWYAMLCNAKISKSKVLCNNIYSLRNHKNNGWVLFSTKSKQQQNSIIH